MCGTHSHINTLELRTTRDAHTVRPVRRRHRTPPRYCEIDSSSLGLTFAIALLQDPPLRINKKDGAVHPAFLEADARHT
jgi:hypothetical protein